MCDFCENNVKCCKKNTYGQFCNKHKRNYLIENGEPFGPDSPVWIYTGGFSSQVQSGAFRQANGNTLITVAQNSRIFEVTYDGEIVWDYTHQGSNMLARAQKYGYDYFITSELGDVNGDENIDVLDIVVVVNIIIETYIPSEVEFSAADLNSDGVVDVLDIVILANSILED